MVRLDGALALPPGDSRVERLLDADEIARFCGTSFARLELELAPFFGIRDAFGELAAVAGARFVTDRIALLAHLARMEAQAAIGALVRRSSKLELVSDELEWGRSLFRVLGKLPLRVTPAA